MDETQQRRQTTQLLLTAVAGLGAFADDTVGFDRGNWRFRVLLEVSRQFLARDVERFTLFGQVGLEDRGRDPGGHRAREQDRVIHITTTETTTVSLP